jgi:hypothetical protein
MTACADAEPGDDGFEGFEAPASGGRAVVVLGAGWNEGVMAEIDTDAARLALAAIAEVDGDAPISDRYREEQALRVATFTDLDLATARRVVEVTYHATTLSELMMRVQVVGAGAEIAATFRQLKRAFQGSGPPAGTGNG